MPDKEQLQEEVNEVLGTDIEFSRMYKDDLEELQNKLKNGEILEQLIKYKGTEIGKKKLEEQVDEWEPGELLARALL